jgi:hypothetical protein
VQLGPHAIQFIQEGNAAMQTRLAQRGPCLWSATLVGDGGETAVIV